MSVPTLKTGSLTLRPPRADDAPAIARILADFEVSKWLVPVPHPYTVADAEAFLAVVGDGRAGQVWAIEHEGTLCGLIGVGPSLGYYLCPEKWGQGLMTGAVRAVVDHYFEITGAEELPSYHFIENVGSGRVLEKAGFVETGFKTSHSLARGEDVRSRTMCLTRDRWTALRAARD